MEALVVPGTLDALEPIANFVLSAASAAGLDQKTTYRLRLAVDELATNMIVHGYDEANLSGDVTLRTTIDDGHLRVILEDTAMPFDPLSLDDPDQINKPLEERPIGGLGIFLVIRSVDKFEYEYVDNKNRYILTVKRPGG